LAFSANLKALTTAERHVSEIKRKELMDKVPPARQTRSRPMTIEAGPSYFSHDGEAQCVLSNLAASLSV